MKHWRQFWNTKMTNAKRRLWPFGRSVVPPYRPAPPVLAATRGPRHHFFGAYDRCPWSPSGRYLLAMETAFGHRPPASDDIADVGLVDLDYAGRYISLADTTAWNWQQGASAQWLPDRDPDCFVYNLFSGSALRSVAVNTRCHVEREYDHPVYALAPDGSVALTLDFRRLTAWRPDGGYAAFGVGNFGAPDADDDGIRVMDMASGRTRLLLSFRSLRDWACDRPDRVTGAYVHRLAFSRDGARLAFLYVSRYGQGPAHSQLLTMAADGTDLYCVTSGFVSHFAWGPDDTITAWCGTPSGPQMAHRWGWVRMLQRGLRGPNLSGRIRRRCRARERRYRLFRDGVGFIRDAGADVLLSEGHPTLTPDGRRLVTDTVPTSREPGALLLYDMALRRAGRLGTFPAQGDIRCHLHPRLAPDGTQICFDSCHEGTRQIYLMDIG